MALDREKAKAFVLAEFKKAIQKRNGDAKIDDDKWAGEPIAEAIASLVDYILTSGEVRVTGAVDPLKSFGRDDGKAHMMGMDDQTGKALAEEERVRRSIRDIVLTPRGTRVLKRDYGCDLIRLVDSPINSSLRVAAAETVISAIRRWEPRVKVSRVELTGDADSLRQGKVILKVYYVHEAKNFVEGISLR